ncbi:MAG: hypothetical protein ACN6NX_12390 [Acinetobacter sp.]
MHNSKLYLFFIGLYFLTGCGEDFGSAGVSLGGSGTGVGFPEPDPPLSGNDGTKPPLENPLKEYFYFFTPVLQMQNCNGIERKIQLENTQTGKLLDNNAKNVLPTLSLTQRQNISARVTIRNLTGSTVYEHTSKCSAYIQELDQYGIALNQSNNNQNCEIENINVYQPAECKVYHYKFAIAQKEALWSFGYSAAYQNMTNDNGDGSLEQCTPLQLNWNILAGSISADSSSSSSSSSMLDDGECE